MSSLWGCYSAINDEFLTDVNRCELREMGAQRSS
jgi:hypothetical protein